MKFLLTVTMAVACLAAVYASECGALQRLKVKRQWASVFGDGSQRLDLGLRIWTNYFSEHPEARVLFERVRGDNEFSSEFEAHSARVLSGLDMAIALLDDQETLDAELAHLKSQHDERGTTAQNFADFKKSFGRAIAMELRSRFDKDSWEACYDLIAKGITG